CWPARERWGSGQRASGGRFEVVAALLASRRPSGWAPLVQHGALPEPSQHPPASVLTAAHPFGAAICPPRRRDSTVSSPRHDSFPACRDRAIPPGLSAGALGRLGNGNTRVRQLTPIPVARF